MPNRIIKESICKSDTLNHLSAEAEVFFYRLLVNCDDYGRFSADPDLLASLLYPRKRSLRSSTVKKWLQEVTNVGLVIIYKHGGDMLLQVRTWDQHQQIRNKRSKYPAYTDTGSEVITDTCNGTHLKSNDSNSSKNHLKSDDSKCRSKYPAYTDTGSEVITDTCNGTHLKSNDSNSSKNHLKSDDSKCPRNPIQSNPNTNPIQNDQPNGDRMVDSFDLFWSVYPKRVGKKDAIKAWGQIKPDEAMVQAIIEGVERWKASEQWTKDGGQFIPYPATFLRGERWNDECQPAIVKKTPAEKNYDDDEDFLKG